MVDFVAVSTQEETLMTLHRAVCYAEVCINVNVLIFIIYKALGKGQLVMCAIKVKAHPIHLISPLG